MDQHPLSTPARQLLAEELGGVCFDRCPAGGQGRADAPVRDELWILGQPPLDDYLHHVQHRAVEAIRPASAADEWRKANDVYHELEQTEAGSADEIETGALPSAMGDVLEEVRADPRYQVTFDTFPTTIEMVELDRLVLSQIHVTQQHVSALCARLGPDPAPADLLRFCCLPAERPSAGVEIRRVGPGRYRFSCESRDFRPHQPTLLRPDQVMGHQTFGPVSGMVGLPVGFGSNFLTAIRFEDRILLHNGYHRACALRTLGLSHAPCILQTVTRRDELRAAANEQVADDPAFFFRSKRPPLLKDYFDPRLRKILRVHATLKVIEVDFTFAEHEVRI